MDRQTDVQRELDFPVAEGQYQERSGVAAARLQRLPLDQQWAQVDKAVRLSRGCDLYLWAICHVVFHRTQTGDYFTASYSDLARLLLCSESKARSTAKKAIACNLVLHIEAVSDRGQQLANQYAIDWVGIVQTAGVPVAVGGVVTNQGPLATNQGPLTTNQGPLTTNQGPGSHPIEGGEESHRTRAHARSVCLSSLSSTSDKDRLFNPEKILDRAAELKRRLGFGGAAKKFPWDFLCTAVVIGAAAGSKEWLDEAVNTAVAARKANRLTRGLWPFLEGCLKYGLVERLGMCTKEERSDVWGELGRAAKPHVEEALKRIANYSQEPK